MSRRLTDWMWGNNGVYHNSDTGSGTGGTPPAGTPPAGGGGSSDSNPPAGNSNPASNGGGNGNPNPETGAGKTVTMTEAELKTMKDELAASVRKSTEAHYEKLSADAKAEADRKAAEEKGEFKTLYDLEKTKASDLDTRIKTLQEENTSLSGRMHDSIDVEIKEWPASIQALDPGRNSPVGARLDWVAKARDIVKEVKTSALPPSNNGMGNGSNGGGGAKDVTDDYLKRVPYAIPGKK